MGENVRLVRRGGQENRRGGCMRGVGGVEQLNVRRRRDAVPSVQGARSPPSWTGGRSPDRHPPHARPGSSPLSPEAASGVLDMGEMPCAGPTREGEGVAEQETTARKPQNRKSKVSKYFCAPAVTSTQDRRMVESCCIFLGLTNP